MPKLTDRGTLATAASDDLLHIVDISDTSGSAEGTSKKIEVANILPTDNCRTGYFQYNDLATQSTALVVLASGGFTDLPNDELGAQTLKTFAPVGVTDLWDATAGEFDWSELKLGDTIEVRLDIVVETSSPNTEIQVELFLGGGTFSIPFVTEKTLKSATSHRLIRYSSFSIDSTFVLNGGGTFAISTSDDCDVVVNGWFLRATIRG